MFRVSGWLVTPPCILGGVGGSIGPFVASLVRFGGSLGRFGFGRSEVDEVCRGEAGLGVVGRGGGVGGRLEGAVGLEGAWGLRFCSGLRFEGELKEAMRFSKLLARDSFPGVLLVLVV